MAESGERSSVEQQVGNSTTHRSELTESDFDSNDDEVAAENREVFKDVQSHPTWGRYFSAFGCTLGTPAPGMPGIIYGSLHTIWKFRSSDELSVGEKFAEGGQAELFHARKHSKMNEDDLTEGWEWVVQVFKKGTLLRHLQSQWPRGMFHYKEEMDGFCDLGKRPPLVYVYDVNCGMLLKDGRFAFLMR